MADDIVQEVKIETTEAEASLERLGETGERTFQRISQAARQVDGVADSLSDVGRSTSGFARAEEAAESFGVALRGVGEATVGLGRQLPSLIGALSAVAGAVTTAMFGMAKSAADATDAIRDAAIAAGTTAQAFSRLAFAAGQSGANTAKLERAFALINAGAPDAGQAITKNAQALEDSRDQTNDAVKSLKRLGAEQQKLKASFFQSSIPIGQQNEQLRAFNVRMQDASEAVFRADRNTQRLQQSQNAANNETGKGLAAMSKLGIALKDADGTARDSTEVFKDFADEIAKLPTPAARAALAAEVLGRRVGPGLVELLSQGRKGIEDLGKQAERLGLVFSAAEIEIGDNFNDALERTTKTIGALATRIGLTFAPGFIKLFDAFNEAIVTLTPAVLKLANIIADVFGPAIDYINKILGPMGLGLGAVTVAIATLAAGASVLVTLLGPLGKLLGGALLAPFIKLGAGAVAIFKLLSSSVVALVAGVRLLGVVALTSFGTLIGPIAAIAAAIGLLVLIFSNAGTSATSFSDVVSSAFKVVTNVVKFFTDTFGTVLKGAFIGLKAIYDEIIVPVFKGIVFLATQVANSVNELFGREVITAAQVLGIAVAALAVLFGGLPAAIAACVIAVGFLVSKISENKAAMILLVTAIGLLVIAFASIPVIIALVLAAVAFVIAKWDEIKAVGGAVAGALRQSWEEFGNWFASTWVGQIISAIKDVITWFKRLGSAASEAEGAAAGGVVSTAGGQGRARGGVIRGPGTGTSDSILAWLSDGEGVLTARALKHYGSRIVGMINSLSLPKNGFAMGGLVNTLAMPSLVPRMATGGVMVSGGPSSKRPIIFQFPDGHEFNADMDIDTADRMGRYANKRRVSSSGRKPTYYGGGR